MTSELTECLVEGHDRGPRFAVRIVVKQATGWHDGNTDGYLQLAQFLIDFVLKAKETHKIWRFGTRRVAHYLDPSAIGYLFNGTDKESDRQHNAGGDRRLT
jgi:hypothetical protein